MNTRKSTRHSLLVDIEIASSGNSCCRGYVSNISRKGLAVILREGEFPADQKSVLLNFKIWTGSETLYRKLLARIIWAEEQKAGMAFAEDEHVTTAIVQDLLRYKALERRQIAKSVKTRRFAESATAMP